MNTHSDATRRPNGANNPGFVAHLQQRSSNRKVVIALIHELMLDQAQPLTVPEVRELAVQAGLSAGYSKFDLALTRQFVNQLVADGLLHARIETDAERHLRSGGKPTAGKNATLYSAADPVPARTQKLAVPGVRLRTVDDRQPRKPRAKKRGRPKGVKNRPKLAERFAEAGLPSGPWVTADPSTVDLLAAVEKLVADRTADLAARLRDAEARAELAETRLAQIRSAIAG